MLSKVHKTQTWMTKSLPLKSAIVLGSLVLPQTNLRKRDLSSLLNSSKTSQNQLIKGALASIPKISQTIYLMT